MSDDLSDSSEIEFIEEPEGMLHCQRKGDYWYRKFYIKNNKNIKEINEIEEIEEKIALLCSIKNDSFVKYCKYNLEQNKITIYFEKYRFPFDDDHDLGFTGINDIIITFENICKGLKEYHDKNISHGKIYIDIILYNSLLTKYF